jgi:hypothetical protein
MFTNVVVISVVVYNFPHAHFVATKFTFSAFSGNRNEKKSLHLFITFVWIIFSALFLMLLEISVKFCVKFIPKYIL